MSPSKNIKKEHTHDKFGLQQMRFAQHNKQPRRYRDITEFVTLQPVSRGYNTDHLTGFGGHSAVAVFNDKAGKMHKLSLRQLRRQLRLAQHEAKEQGQHSPGAAFVKLASPLYTYMSATLNNSKPQQRTSAVTHAKRIARATLGSLSV